MPDCGFGERPDIGNVWRFPYLCGKNGGAAFMVPYLIMMIFAGFPVFYMELALGQFAQLSPVLLYERMSPIFAGLGTCMVLAQAYTAIYYNMIIAWSLHYLGNSFRSPLRWSHCTNDYNTFRCYDDILFENCVKENKTYYTGQCMSKREISDITPTIAEHWEISLKEKFPKNETKRDEFRANYSRLTQGLNEEQLTQYQIQSMYNLSGRWSPTKEYLYLRMLRLSKGIEPQYYGTPQWELVLCLLGAWILIFFCLLGGTKTSGKVVYFTATFPYLILIILLGRGLSLGKGVMDGLRFFLVPKIKPLTEGGTWGAAATQIFFSLSLGGGGLTTIASYNKFHNNLFRDTLIVVLGNCATSFFAGLVIFPVVGYIAAELQQNVADIARDGIGLAFVVYPHAINRMAVPQLWAFLFFFMLVLLGIDSQLVMTETPLTAVLDAFPQLRSRWKKVATVGIACTLGFLIGLVFTTPGGPYFLSLMDNYGGGWPLVISCIIELIMVMWVYGIQNFISDVRLMLGKPPNTYYKVMGYPVNWYWIANWAFITPVLLIAVLIFDFVSYSRSEYDSTYVYPIWADVLGWLITLSCVAFVPGVAIYKIIRAKQRGLPLSSLVKPTSEWGPGDPDVRGDGGAYSPGGAGGGGAARDNKGYAKETGHPEDGPHHHHSPASAPYPQAYAMSEVSVNGGGGSRPPSYMHAVGEDGSGGIKY